MIFKVYICYGEGQHINKDRGKDRICVCGHSTREVEVVRVDEMLSDEVLSRVDPSGSLSGLNVLGLRRVVTRLLAALDLPEDTQ